MRKVTRTLFHDDEDDETVNCSSVYSHTSCFRSSGTLSVSQSSRTVSASHLVVCVCRPLQGAHSTSGADNEYNLRSRTVICDSCGQSSDRGTGVCSSGGLPEGLGGHSFFMGTNEPRQVRHERRDTTRTTAETRHEAEKQSKILLQYDFI